MFSLRKILFPTDYSERSAGAAHYVKALACHFHSELDVLNVIDLRVLGMYGMGNDEEALERFGPGCKKAAEAEMELFLPNALPGVKVKRVFVCGDPAREIVKYAAAEKPDLIVMPTHGYGPFRRFLLGSVTTKVLHDAHCPVWTGVHMDQTVQPPIGFRRVLCALDIWQPHQQALEWAWQFGNEMGSEVRIVHVLPPVYGPDSPFFDPEVRASKERAAELELLKTQMRAGTKAQVEIRVGEAATEVCAAATAWGADLVVIGRGVASEFMGRLRTRSYYIIRDSPCPVVSV